MPINKRPLVFFCQLRGGPPLNHRGSSSGMINYLHFFFKPVDLNRQLPDLLVQTLLLLLRLFLIQGRLAFVEGVPGSPFFTGSLGLDGSRTLG